MGDLFEHPAVTRAKSIWAEREKGMPKFVRQTWEQGTDLAQRVTVWGAAYEMGFIDEPPPTHKSSHQPPQG